MMTNLYPLTLNLLAFDPALMALPIATPESVPPLSLIALLLIRMISLPLIVTAEEDGVPTVPKANPAAFAAKVPPLTLYHRLPLSVPAQYDVMYEPLYEPPYIL